MAIRWWRKTRSLSCEDALNVLQSYMDDETSTDTALQVVTHLENCGPCENELHMFRRIKISLSQRSDEVNPVVLDALRRYGERLSNGEPDENGSDTGLI